MAREGEQVLRDPEREENTFNQLSRQEKEEVAKAAKFAGKLVKYMEVYL